MYLKEQERRRKIFRSLNFALRKLILKLDRGIIPNEKEILLLKEYLKQMKDILETN